MVVGAELPFHLVCVDKDVVSEHVLDSQRCSIQERIRQIPLPRVDVVRGECDLFAEEPVIYHQYCTVEQLEVVIPENVQNFRAWAGGIAEQSQVKCRHSSDFY